MTRDDPKNLYVAKTKKVNLSTLLCDMLSTSYNGPPSNKARSQKMVLSDMTTLLRRQNHRILFSILNFFFVKISKNSTESLE